MDTQFEKLRSVVSAPASLLLASVVMPIELLAQDELTTRPTFQETHALIEELRTSSSRVELKGFYENWPGDYPYIFTKK